MLLVVVGEGVSESKGSFSSNDEWLVCVASLSFTEIN